MSPRPDFDIYLQAFIKQLKERTDKDVDERRARYPHLGHLRYNHWEVDELKRYLRIVQVYQRNVNSDDTMSKRCHGFIDRETGEFLKGSWKAPRITKKCRGTIFEPTKEMLSVIS